MMYSYVYFLMTHHISVILQCSMPLVKKFLLLMRFKFSASDLANQCYFILPPFYSVHIITARHGDLICLFSWWANSLLTGFSLVLITGLCFSVGPWEMRLQRSLTMKKGPSFCRNCPKRILRSYSNLVPYSLNSKIPCRLSFWFLL